MKSNGRHAPTEADRIELLKHDVKWVFGEAEGLTKMIGVLRSHVDDLDRQRDPKLNGRGRYGPRRRPLVVAIEDQAPPKRRPVVEDEPPPKRQATARQLKGLYLRRNLQRHTLDAAIAGIEKKLSAMGEPVPDYVWASPRRGSGEAQH